MAAVGQAIWRRELSTRNVAGGEGEALCSALSRAALVSRWQDLTRRQLPGMAKERRWPIRLDHCFMRVCLDASYRRPWHEAIARPAIRHASDAELARAIAIAEGILREPGTLPALNAASLRMRGKARAT